MEIQSNKFKVIVKPNKPENRIRDFDSANNTYNVDIKSKSQENKANIELVKFFTKLLKKKVIINSGLRSKEKILEIIN